MKFEKFRLLVPKRCDGLMGLQLGPFETIVYLNCPAHRHVSLFGHNIKAAVRELDINPLIKHPPSISQSS